MKSLQSELPSNQNDVNPVKENIDDHEKAKKKILDSRNTDHSDSETEAERSCRYQRAPIESEISKQIKSFWLKYLDCVYDEDKVETLPDDHKPRFESLRDSSRLISCHGGEFMKLLMKDFRGHIEENDNLKSFGKGNSGSNWKPIPGNLGSLVICALKATSKTFDFVRKQILSKKTKRSQNLSLKIMDKVGIFIENKKNPLLREYFDQIPELKEDQMQGFLQTEDSCLFIQNFLSFLEKKKRLFLKIESQANLNFSVVNIFAPVVQLHDEMIGIGSFGKLLQFLFLRTVDLIKLLTEKEIEQWVVLLTQNKSEPPSQHYQPSLFPFLDLPLMLCITGLKYDKLEKSQIESMIKCLKMYNSQVIHFLAQVQQFDDVKAQKELEAQVESSYKHIEVDPKNSNSKTDSKINNSKFLKPFPTSARKAKVFVASKKKDLLVNKGVVYLINLPDFVQDRIEVPKDSKEAIAKSIYFGEELDQVFKCGNGPELQGELITRCYSINDRKLKLIQQSQNSKTICSALTQTKKRVRKAFEKSVEQTFESISKSIAERLKEPRIQGSNLVTNLKTLLKIDPRLSEDREKLLCKILKEDTEGSIVGSYIKSENGYVAQEDPCIDTVDKLYGLTGICSEKRWRDSIPKKHLEFYLTSRCETLSYLMRSGPVDSRESLNVCNIYKAILAHNINQGRLRYESSKIVGFESVKKESTPSIFQSPFDCFLDMTSTLGRLCVCEFKEMITSDNQFLVQNTLQTIIGFQKKVL